MSNKKRKILCIEDEQEMIELVRLILEKQGYQVIGAIGGEQGLEFIAKEKPDLVILDLMMPGMDGWEVYQRMKGLEGAQEIPVIILTAKAQVIDRVLGLHIAQVDDYITKPFGPQELVDSIEKALANKTASPAN
jgi:two-component system response regulator VicR